MEQKSSDKRFALLIDADNVSARYIKPILNELSKYGTVTVKRIYGDWTLTLHAKWKDALLENSITPIQQFGYTQGKNATDSAMIIDAMDILYTDSVDGFCIVSSDSDFTRLASRLRESGRMVIGMGEKKTPTPFRRACDVFTTLELLVEKRRDAGGNGAPAMSKDEVEQAVVDIITDNQNNGKATGLGEVGSRMLKRYPDFDVRSYGTNLLSKLLSEFTRVRIIKDHSSVTVELAEGAEKSSEKKEHAEKSSEKSEKGEKGEKKERAERPDADKAKAEKAERAEKGERAEKPKRERAEKSGHADAAGEKPTDKAEDAPEEGTEQPQEDGKHAEQPVVEKPKRTRRSHRVSTKPQDEPSAAAQLAAQEEPAAAAQPSALEVEAAPAPAEEASAEAASEEPAKKPSRRRRGRKAPEAAPELVPEAEATPAKEASAQAAANPGSAPASEADDVPAPEAEAAPDAAPAPKPAKRRGRKPKAKPAPEPAADAAPEAAPAPTGAPDAAQTPQELIRQMVRGAGAGGINLSQIGNAVRSQFKDFKVRDLGFAQLRQYVNSIDDFSVEKVGKDVVVKLAE